MHWQESSMKFISWKRLTVILVAGLGLCVTLIMGSWSLEHPAPWYYAVLLLIMLLFFAVGSLVWLFAQNRKEAALLFSFCLSLAVASNSAIGVSAGNRAIETLGSSSTSLAALLLLLFSLSFPRNLFVLIHRGSSRGKMLYAFIVLTLFLFGITLYASISMNLFAVKLPSWFYGLGLIHYLLSSVSSFLLIVNTLRRGDIRQQQQARFFLIGIALSLLPILLLTILPTLLNFSYILDGRVAILFLLALPLMLGFSLMRYQLFVLEQYIRKVMHWVISVISLALLTYLLVAISERLFGISLLFYVSVAGVLPLVAWLVIQRGQYVIDILFFSEIRHYQNFVNELPLRFSLHLRVIALALIVAVQDTLSAPAALLLLVDEEHQGFRPPLTSINDTTHLASLLSATSPVQTRENTDGSLFAALQQIAHPIFLAD